MKFCIMQFSPTSAVFVPNIPFRTLFYNTLGLGTSLRMRYTNFTFIQKVGKTVYFNFRIFRQEERRQSLYVGHHSSQL
jgi:hypothetical protein